jgi:hypothetical protein
VIFSPELLPKVLDGTKTVTRRRVKPHEQSCRYVPGRTYAVQDRRGGRGIGRIRVNTVRQEPFSDITADEARLEGFTDASEMRAWWVTRYGVEAYEAPVWRIEFEIHEREGFLLVEQPECVHTPSPQGFLDWHAWAAEKNKTHRQRRCPVCGLWAIWVPKDAEVLA